MLDKNYNLYILFSWRHHAMQFRASTVFQRVLVLFSTWKITVIDNTACVTAAFLQLTSSLFDRRCFANIEYEGGHMRTFCKLLMALWAVSIWQVLFVRLGNVLTAVTYTDLIFCFTDTLISGCHLKLVIPGYQVINGYTRSSDLHPIDQESCRSHWIH